MKITKQQLKQIIKEELTRALNEQEGTFTYNVIKDEFDGGPRVDIEGINRTFAQMMQDLDGKEIDDEWEGPWTFKLENFREHEEEDVDDLLNSIIVDSAPGELIEAWAKMNGLEARRIGV